MSLIEEAHKLLLSKPSIELGARKSCVKASPMDKKTDCEKIISIRNRFTDNLAVVSNVLKFYQTRV